LGRCICVVYPSHPQANSSSAYKEVG
jgi:hypothetical protein